MLVIKNGRVHNAIDKDAKVMDILVDNGKIVKVEENIDVEGTVIDANGLDIYPGFIDAHAHLGLDGYGIGYERQDYNEAGDILSSQLRAIDAFNPLDPTVKAAALAGVTCVGTGPGSADVLGGTFIAVKTYGNRVDDMIVKNPVAMKCAFGENPKRCYRDRGNMSRMTTAANLRSALYKAKEYLAKKEAAGDDVFKKPAFDLKMEGLIPVIKKEIPLKAHAHTIDDMFTAIRIAKELDVDLTLEHCTEGHLVADKLVAENYPMAVGPGLTHATKFELRDITWQTPGILSKLGGQVSIITDSPVIPQTYLPMCAGLAVKNGMDEFEALKAITINPAKHLGIDDKVGSIEVGKDADLVVVSGHPFDLNHEVKYVFINGEEVK